MSFKLDAIPKTFNIGLDFKPEHELVMNFINYVSTEFGVPFSKKMVAESYKEAVDRERELKQVMTGKYAHIGGMEFIEFTARSHISPHIANIIYTYYMDILGDTNPFTVVTTRSNVKKEEYTTKDEVLREVYEVIKNSTDDTELVDMFMEFKEIDKFLRSMKQIIDPCISDKTNNPYFSLHPTVEIKDTFRLATNNPNIQGKTQRVKQMMMAPEGHTIITIDISGQEVHILIFGIMTNKELQRLCVEMGDPYYAILKYLGYPQTPEYKSWVKVPVLGLMNGMAQPTMERNMGYIIDPINQKEADSNRIIKTLVKEIRDLVEGDEGFKTTVLDYVETNKRKSNAVAKGLFNSERTLPRFVAGKPVSTNEKINKLRNGFFQITASEITSLSLQGIIYFILNNNIGITLNNFRPLTSIYDEFIFICRDEVLEQAKQLVDTYMKPKVGDWARFRGEIMTGKYYGHK